MIPLNYKLLARQLNPFQLLGFVLANLCGMGIVLMAVQFYVDVIPLFTKGDSFLKEGQVVVNKHVGEMRLLSGGAPAFRQREIDELRAQPFVRDVGLFTPSRFGVMATIGSRSMGMTFATEMFFEAVPDEYIDVDLSRWHYAAGADTIPIILPRNYLNLYNFGFAASRGLPSVSESLVKLVPIQLRLHGAGGSRELTGKVVAFSKRLNTILVPQAFMDEANRSLAPGSPVEASRLVLSVTNIADSRLADYLEAHNYETEAGDADAARTVSLLRTVVVIVLAVGLIISLLSFYLLLLSIFLLLQKHTEKIDNLLLIGYAPRSVVRPFLLLAVGLNALVLVGALVISSASRSFYLPRFGELYPRYEIAAFWPTLLTGLLLFLLVACLNALAIRRKVLNIWAMHRSSPRSS